MPTPVGRPIVTPTVPLPVFSPDETTERTTQPADAFAAPSTAAVTPPGLRSTATDAVELFGADLATALTRGTDPNVPTRLPLEALVRFAARAAADAVTPDDRARLADEVKRQAAPYASEALTSLSLGVLEQIVRHADRHAGEGAAGAWESGPKSSIVEATNPREQLEAWLVLAAKGKRASGAELGRWTAPYVIGTTDIPRSNEVISGVGRLLNDMTGGQGTARAHLTRYEAIDAARAEAAKGPVNVLVWGHSAGGPAAVSVANTLQGTENADVKSVLMLDPVNVLRLPPTLPQGKPEIFSLYLGAGNLFEIGPGWKRWHVGETDTRRVAQVKETTHFGMLGALYDRGILQQVAAKAVLGD